MNESSISQIPQCIRQITHNAPFSNIFLLQNGALWDMGLVHWGVCAMGLLINLKFVLVNKSEFLGIKRSWIKKTYTIDMETWFLFTANENAFFNNSGTRLSQRAETGLLDSVIFTVSRSSIQCNRVWWSFSTKLRNVALILCTLYLRHFLIIMSFCLNYARGWPGPKRPVSVFCVTFSQKYL